MDNNALPFEITPQQLRELLASSHEVTLLDVREAQEIELAAFPGAQHIPMRRVPENLPDLDPQTHYICICHHGARSARVTHFLRMQGRTAQNLDGGIDRWSLEIDAAIPRY